ncbi:MAG: hypothetical protein RIT24_14, partial [Planctomycetota bacterium]
MKSSTSPRFFASLVLCAAAAAAGSASAAVRYVNVGLTTGSNDGSSWANAYRGVDGIATAVTASVSGDEVWVAAGTYKPTATTSRTVSITLKTGVGIYGGFAGVEITRDARDVA